jgi:hypothetical protein
MLVHARRLAAALALALLPLSLPLAASAATLHDEAVDGDLSGDPMAPDAFTLALGSNVIAASSVSLDLEYVALTVPSGLVLRRIVLESYVSADDVAFIGAVEDDVFDAPPDPLLGWAHFGPGGGLPQGADVLPAMGMAIQSIGFTPPLGPSTYTFWMQQTGPEPTAFRFDFVVAAVPEPGAAALLLGAAAALAVSRTARRGRGER